MTVMERVPCCNIEISTTRCTAIDKKFILQYFLKCKRTYIGVIGVLCESNKESLYQKISTN